MCFPDKRSILGVLFVVALFFCACSSTSENHGEPADAGVDTAGDAPDGDTSHDAGEPTARQVLVPDGERVYPGWYSHDIAGEWEDIQQVLGGVPPVTFTFHDWNAAGTGSGRVDLQTFEAPLEGQGGATVLEFARSVSADGGVLAVAWDAIGYVVLEDGYWTGELELAVSFADILEGDYDDYIRTCARQIRELGVPILLSPFSEITSTAWFMFGPDELSPLESVDDTRIHFGDPDLPDGPERLRAAYRHVVDIFREERVDNVTWFIYASTGYMNPAKLDPAEIERMDEVHPRYFYPGDDYVDWIGHSLYVEAGDDADLGAELDFGLTAWREVTQRPFFSPEFGVVAPDGKDRTATLQEMVEQLPASGVSLVGFADSALYDLVFDIPRLRDSEDEAAAWRQVMDDSRYSRQLMFEQR